MSNVTIETIKNTFNNIDLTINTINPVFSYDELAEQFILLCEQINDYIDSGNDSERVWYIGESGYCLMADLIPAAYWHYSQWHGGQYSESYQALSALGTIFSPNMSCEPEEDDPEYEVFSGLNELAEKYHNGN